MSIVLLLSNCGESPPAPTVAPEAQPIRFNHKLHTVDHEMECQDCHEHVLKGRKATLPGPETCRGCHEEMQGETEEERKLVALLNSGADLNWRRVYVLPEHVYFSHFRHVTLGQITCQRCHGDMRALTSPPTRPAVGIIDMGHCMSCHEEKQVNNDCLMCHA